MARTERAREAETGSDAVSKPSRTAQAACDLILSRDAIGLAKYGKSMDREDLKPREWLQHAIEESADGIQYMIRLGVDLERIARAAYQMGQNSIIRQIGKDGRVGPLNNDSAAIDEEIKWLLG